MNNNMNNNRMKDEALGMPHGTAANKLRKMIMFDLLDTCGKNTCFKCGKIIETVDELSIEHKESWLYADDPKEAFFSLDNIAFSHLRCNVPHNRPGPIGLRKTGPEGTAWCNGCKEFIDRTLFAKGTRWDGLNPCCQDCTNRRKRENRRLLRA
jgi:hypothetical protein